MVGPGAVASGSQRTASSSLRSGGSRAHRSFGRCNAAIGRCLALLAGVVTGGASPARAGPCADDVRVVAAQLEVPDRLEPATEITRPTLHVVLRSTATTSISAVELALFVGTSLDEVLATRPHTLPTRLCRRYPSGGLAFRTEVPARLPPGAQRSVRFTPAQLDRMTDARGLTVKVLRCRRWVPVGSATIELPPREDPWLVWLYMAGMALAALTGAMILARLR